MVKIVCEGSDDKSFLRQLLQHLQKEKKIDSEIKDFNSFIQSMNGKSKLLDNNNYSALSKQVLSKKIKKVLFIFDCDFIEDDNSCGGMEKSKECYSKLIKKLAWNIKTDFYIFDRNLDYFLVETIKDKECYCNFDSLIKCLELEEIKPNKKPIANLYKDLYPYPKFNYEDDKFYDLKQKLINLFKEEE